MLMAASQFEWLVMLMAADQAFCLDTFAETQCKPVQQMFAAVQQKHLTSTLKYINFSCETNSW